MKKIKSNFEGFNKDIFLFLKELSRNNNINWFDKNRERYQNKIVEPARKFVIDIGEFFNRLNPTIRTAPKFNETLMRINNDMRFAQLKPYKNYFLIHFGRFKLDSEFYIYFDHESCQLGLFINNSLSEAEQDFFFYKNFDLYKKELINICEKFGINNKFELYEFVKDSKLLTDSFNAGIHLDQLKNLKMFLLQKSLSIDDPRIYSSDFLIEAIKTFSILYPIYCFSISPDPLKLIEDFENNFGMIE